MSVSVTILCCFYYYNFIVFSEVWESYAFSFVLFPQDCLAILGLLWFHINVSIICFSSMKSVTGNLIEIVLNL